ncbi:MAG: TRAP transporter substrate-binding protein [Rhodospirillales bacterium]|nr:TRAP transporter substrate-binding protein [Rhodospirillales bacterium]
MKSRSTLTTLTMAAALLMAGTAAAADKITMKIAHGNSADPMDPYQVIALKFQEAVQAKTDKLEVQIFPGGQLGAEQRAFQDVQNGIVQAAVLASNNVSAFASSMSVLDLPFLFRSNDDFVRVVKEANDDFTRAMIAESGTMPLSWGVQGFRIIANNKKQVHNLNDLQGLKIRVPNNAVQVATFKAWGSDAVPMAFGELFGALQQKVIDGLEMTYISLASMKYYEVINHVTDVRYKLAINPMVISEQWFGGLPADVQKAVLEAGRETTDHAMTMAAEMDEKGKDILAKNGVTLFGQPTDEGAWVEKARTTWPQVIPRIKDKAMLEKVFAVLGVKN